MLTPSENNHNQRVSEYRNRLRNRGVKRIEVTIPAQDVPLIHSIAGMLREGGEQAEVLRQQIKQATGDDQQNTGKDLIAFFRNSPLADVALDLERDKATSRTIAF